MRSTYPHLDEDTQTEHIAAVVIMHSAFEEAAKMVDTRFPGIDADCRTDLIRETGHELIETAALAMEYDETIDNVSEGLVAKMLLSACNLDM